jgi:WD40 repeat protein
MRDVDVRQSLISGAAARQFVRHRGPVTAVALALGESRVISSGYDGAVGVFDLSSGEVSLLGYHRHLVNRVVLSNDGRVAATCSSDYTVGLWDLQTGQPRAQLLGHYDDVEDFVFIDDELGASASRDRRIIIWELATGRIVRILEGHDRDVLALAGHDGRLYSSGDDRTLRVWDLLTGRLLTTWGPFDAETDTCALVPDRGRAVLGCDDGHLRVFDTRSGELIADLPGHRSGVKKVAVSPLTGDLLSAAYDQRVVVWDANTLTPKLEIPTSRGVWERSLCFSADGRRILAGTFDGKVVSLSVETGELELELGRDQDSPGNPCLNGIGCSRAGVTVAVSDDGFVRVGQILGSEVGWHTRIDPVGARVLMNAVALGPDGQTAAAGTHDGRVLIYSLAGERPELRALAELGQGPINTIDFRVLDDTWELYVGCYSGAIVVVDASGAIRRRIELHEGAVKALRTYVDERGEGCGVSCGADGMLLSWSADGKLLHSFLGHTAIINDVDIDVASRRVASVSRDFTLKIWDLDAGKLVFNQALGRRSLKSVCFWASNRVLVGDYWGGLSSVDLDTGAVTRRQVARNGLSALARCGDGVVAASYTGEAVLVDPQTLDERRRLVAMQQRLDPPGDGWELRAVAREEQVHA